MMTDQQRDELAAIDAAIASDASAPINWARRARLRAEMGADIASLMTDMERAISLGRNTKPLHALVMGHDHMRAARHETSPFRARFKRAMAGAYIWLALQSQAGAVAWVTRDLVAQLCEIDDGQRVWDWLEDAADDADESPAMWHTLAIVLAVLSGVKQGAQLYCWALKLEIEDGDWPDGESGALARAQDHDLPLYQQLGWFDWLIENSPYDVELRLKRAHWSELHGRNNSARDDFYCALVLRPNDPEIWEARAAHFFFGRPPKDESAFLLASADFAEALQLRIKTGEVSGYAHDLQTRGDALMKAPSDPRLDPPRAHAFYTLAIERKPDAAQLYLKRALSLHTSVNRNAGESHAAYLDYLRALALQPALDKARAGIVRHLTKSLARPTAHEQLEALLDERQFLRDAGLTPELVSAIIGEVERALTKAD